MNRYQPCLPIPQPERYELTHVYLSSSIATLVQAYASHMASVRMRTEDNNVRISHCKRTSSQQNLDESRHARKLSLPRAVFNDGKLKSSLLAQASEGRYVEHRRREHMIFIYHHFGIFHATPVLLISCGPVQMRVDHIIIFRFISHFRETRAASVNNVDVRRR